NRYISTFANKKGHSLGILENGRKGGNRNRTGDQGVADPCLTAWLYHHEALNNAYDYKEKSRLFQAQSAE
ncbi:hypothetical protein FFRU_090860, partial [Fructobacillus fructosus]